MSFTTTRYASPQQFHRGAPRRQDTASQEAALETYRALPAPDHVYSDYDFEIIAEIISLAEQQAQALARKGKGLGEITLQRLLKAYEQVLPRYQVKPQEDIYYYRFLLKLSLDPDPNWWAKFYRECNGLGGSQPAQRPQAKAPQRSSSTPRFREPSPGRASQWSGRGPSEQAERQSQRLAPRQHHTYSTYAVQPGAGGLLGQAVPVQQGSGAAGAGGQRHPAAGFSSPAGGDASGGLRNAGGATLPTPSISISQRYPGSTLGQMPLDARVSGLQPRPSGTSSADPTARRPVTTPAPYTPYIPSFGDDDASAAAGSRPVERGSTPAAASAGAGRGAGNGGGRQGAGAGAGASGSAAGLGTGAAYRPGASGHVGRSARAGHAEDQRQPAGAGPAPSSSGPGRQGSFAFTPGPSYGPGAGQGDLSAQARDFVMPEEGLGVGANSQSGIRDLVHRRNGDRNLGGISPHQGMGSADAPGGGDVGLRGNAGPSRTSGFSGGLDSRGTAGSGGRGQGGAYLSSGYGDPSGGDRYQPRQEASEAGSEASGTSQGSEADAYLDFQRTAKSFRTWRDHAFILRESRAAKEEAVANWNVALAFWELHLVQRCFLRWANHKQEALAMVLDRWRASSLRDCFLRWREVTKYLKVAGLMSDEHRAEKTKRKCFTWWRIYVEMRRIKDSKALRALMFWSGNTLKMVFVIWRTMTREAIESGHHADSYYEAQARGKLLLAWRAAATQQRKLRQAEDTIRLALHSRLAARCLAMWQSRWQTAARHHLLLGRAVSAMRNRSLRSAFVAMRDYVGKKQRGRELAATALGHWHNGRLSACWNSWLSFMASKRSKQGKMEHALAFMTNRTQAQAWQSWVGLVLDARDKMRIAEDYCRQHGTPLQQGCFELWREWCGEQVTKAQRLAELQERMQAYKQHRIMQVWCRAAQQRKLDLAAFDAIVKLEVRRVSSAAAAVIVKACRTRSLVLSATSALTESITRRVLREWWAAARVLRQRRRRWTLIVDRMTIARHKRLLRAWRLVTAIRIEQYLLVLSHLERRRQAVRSGVLAVLRMHVRHRAAKRAAMLKALMHWDFVTKAKAMSGWVGRTLLGRAKRGKLARAERHHRTRVLQKTFGVWLALLHIVQDKTERALMHWSGREDVKLTVILHAWRDAARVRAVKHGKVRLAVAHWMGNRMAVAFYTWHEATQHWLIKRAKMRVAVAKWVGTSLSKAFTWWKEWALNKVLRNRKARAYLALLLGRAAAFAFFMLRSNAIRKRKTRGARHHRRHVILRTAYQSWKLRVFLSAELQRCLSGVFHQMLGHTLRLAFNSWILAVQEGDHKRQVMAKALQLWVHRRQAAAFRALRSYQLRKHMSRALLLKYRVGLAAVVMKEWRAVTRHRVQCKAKTMSMLYKTERQVLRQALDAWFDWIHLKRNGELQNSRAAGHLTNILLGKAWNSWLEYHDRMAVARRVLLHMMQMKMGQAFNAWWGAVLERREVLAQMDVAVARLQNRSMLQAFNMLWAQVERRRKKRMADAHYFSTRFRIIFHAWRVGAKLEMAVNLWTGNVLAATFRQWRSYTQNQRRLQLTGEQVARRWYNLELATAFRTWRMAVNVVAYERYTMNRAVQHWQNGCMGAAFDSWRWYLAWKWRMRDTARAVITRMAGAAKLRAFNSWRCFMALQARKAMAVRHAEVACMRRAFFPWLALTDAKVQAAERAEQLFERVTTALASETLSAVFDAWRNQARTMPRLRAILARILGRHLSLAFNGWREVAENQKQKRLWGTALEARLAGRPLLRQRCVAAVNRWASWPLSYAFYTWLDRVREHQGLQHRATLAVFSYAGSLLRKAWVAWRSYASTKANLQKRLRQVVIAMGGMRLERCFYWWLALSKYLRHMKGAMAAIQGGIAFRIMLGVWQAWQQRVYYSRVGRGAIARLAMRTQLAVLQQWREHASLMRQQRAKVQLALGRIMNRALAAAFSAWRSWAQERARLNTIKAQVLGKLRQGALARAWAGWVDFMQLRAAKQLKLEAVVAHWGSNALRKAFNTWREAWEEATRGTLAAVHYYGGLLDRCWLAWREAVADAELYKGNSKRRRVVLSRAVACWKAYVHDARLQRQLAMGISALAVCQKVLAWRHMTKARLSMRRLYMRRALLGWCMRTLEWQRQRELLQHAAQVIIFGMQARCFMAWLGLVREQAAKRVVFAQKQAALQEALRFGERLRQRRNAELLSTTFYAWRMKTGIYRRVAMRFASICHHTLSSCFLTWHAFVVERRHSLHTALEHRRLLVLRRTLGAWREKAKEYREVAVLFEGVAEEHWYVTCASKVLRCLHEASTLGLARREALAKVLNRKFDLEDKELMSKTMSALRALMARKLDLFDLAEATSKGRARRRLAEVFNLWHTYTVAMRGDLDPGSPFLSPRTKREDRQLIRNVATFVGSPEAVALSEGSSNASSEDLERAHEVMTRREAYLRIASPERRQTGFSGVSSTYGNVSLRSGFTTSPRTTSGGEGPALGMPPSSLGYGPGVVELREEEWRGLRDDQVGYDALYRSAPTPDASTGIRPRVAVQPGLTPPVFRGFGSGQVLQQPAASAAQRMTVAASTSSAYVTPTAAGARGYSQLYTPSGLGSQPGAVLLTSGWPTATPVPASQSAMAGAPQQAPAASASRQSILSKAVQLQAAAAATRRGSSLLSNAQTLAGRGQQGGFD